MAVIPSSSGFNFPAHWSYSMTSQPWCERWRSQAIPDPAHLSSFSVITIRDRDDSRFSSSQWETALLCNDFSHWLDASLESVLRVKYLYFRTTAGSIIVMVEYSIGLGTKCAAFCRLHFQINFFNVNKLLSAGILVKFSPMGTIDEIADKL